MGLRHLLALPEPTTGKQLPLGKLGIGEVGKLLVILLRKKKSWQNIHKYRISSDGYLQDGELE